jgi:hypothetical protein
VTNLVKAFALVALGLAIAAMGIEVSHADDAPGAAVIGFLLLLPAVLFGVRTARNRLPIWAARTALAVDILVAAFAAFLTHAAVVKVRFAPAWLSWLPMVWATGLSAWRRIIPGRSVKFPALCIPRDFGVYLVHDTSQLRRVRAQLFWAHHHFDGLRIIDSSAKTYAVKTAEVASPASTVGRRLARLFDLTIAVDLKLVAVGSASFSEVVAAVQRATDVDPEAFEVLSGRTIEWWRTTLGQTTAVDEVIRAFADANRRS